jgi:hypothetical protein
LLRFRGEPFSELQAPLAPIVSDGLTASTLMTLLFVPTVYTPFKDTVIARLDPSLLATQQKARLVNAKAILERQKDSK